jgi:hypothetical protein
MSEQSPDDFHQQFKSLSIRSIIQIQTTTPHHILNTTMYFYLMQNKKKPNIYDLAIRYL